MSGKYYAVVKGRVPGIYTTWKDTQAQVTGFSGAIYKSFKTKQEAEDFYNKSNNTVNIDINTSTIIYTDGSCKDLICGYGIVIFENNEKITYYGKVPRTVMINKNKLQYNDVAELYAIYIALYHTKGDTILYTDCMYAVTTLKSYIHDWIKTNTLKERENYELLLSIYNLMKDRNVDIKHVEAHVGIQYNEECDQLANKGRLLNHENTIKV